MNEGTATKERESRLAWSPMRVFEGVETGETRENAEYPGVRWKNEKAAVIFLTGTMAVLK